MIVQVITVRLVKTQNHGNLWPADGAPAQSAAKSGALSCLLMHSCSAMDRYMQHSVFHTIAFLAFSCLAISTLASWCRKFMSRIFSVPTWKRNASPTRWPLHHQAYVILICERHAHSWYRVTLVWFCAGRRCSASRWRSRSRWSVVAGSREPSGTCWWWTCARQQMRARTPLCTTATHTSLVHSTSTEVNNCKLNWTDINWPAVSRPSYTTHHDAFIGHARQRHDLTGCSETTRLANKNEATNSWP